MKEVLDELFAAYQSGDTTAMATVVRTWRSAPRPAGASMLVNVAGEATGSVSGGCVEGAVYELAGEVIANGVPQFEKYGISNDDAFAVGLTCGGILEVFVEQVSKETWPELPDLFASVQADQPVAVATVVNGTAHVGKHLVVWPDRIAGDLGSSRLNSAVGADVLGLLESGTTGFLHYGSDGERLEGDLEIFVSTFAPKPRMLVFGAIDFAAAVAKAAVAKATIATAAAVATVVTPIVASATVAATAVDVVAAASAAAAAVAAAAAAVAAVFPWHHALIITVNCKKW